MAFVAPRRGLPSACSAHTKVDAEEVRQPNLRPSFTGTSKSMSLTNMLVPSTSLRQILAATLSNASAAAQRSRPYLAKPDLAILIGRIWPIFVDRIWPFFFWWGGLKGLGPGGWGPGGWGAQNFALFFFLSPAGNFLLSSLSRVFSWNFGGVCDSAFGFGSPPLRPPSGPYPSAPQPWPHFFALPLSLPSSPSKMPRTDPGQSR